MNFIDRIKQWFSERREVSSLEKLLLSAGVYQEAITKEQALNIPTFSAGLEFVSNTVAMLPIWLYKRDGDRVERITNDRRTTLLNDDTGDTLDSFQMKKAFVRDYLIGGSGYVYMKKERNTVKSLHYVDPMYISVQKNVDPIFKDYDILVQGERYRPYDFIKILRNTQDGSTGIGILQENNDLLTLAYNILRYENILVMTGGNKRGFIKSKARLTKEAMANLKEQWRNMYQNNTENCIVLNEGLDFQEASSTSVEMQLNENKRTNSDEICKLLNLGEMILNGRATDEVYNTTIKIAVLPILREIETALNKDYLLEKERESYFFAFDTKDLLKVDMEKRYRAYEIASRNGFMQIDEIRTLENLAPLGLDFVKLGLQDVLLDVDTGEIYTPNTNQLTSLKGGEGGNENRDQK